MSDEIEIEYRVRPVTRYTLTRYLNDGGAESVGVVAEFMKLTDANALGEKLARIDNFDHIGHPSAVIGFESLAPVEPKMRCKMRLTNLMRHVGADGEVFAAKVNFHAVWGGSDPDDGGNAAHENRIFSHATPSASFEAYVQNTTTVEMLMGFPIGQDFYVDFTPAPMK